MTGVRRTAHEKVGPKAAATAQVGAFDYDTAALFWDLGPPDDHAARGVWRIFESANQIQRQVIARGYDQGPET